MYKTRKRLIFLSVNAAILILFIVISTMLMPERIKEYSFFLLISIPSVIFVLLLIGGEFVRSVLDARLHRKIFEKGETRYLTRFINRLRFCYSLDDLYKVFADVLEKEAGCSVLFVDREKIIFCTTAPTV